MHQIRFLLCSLMMFTFSTLSAQAFSEKDFVTSYATTATWGYGEAVKGARGLDVAIKEFLKSPGDSTLAKAKKAWVDLKMVYMPTEVYRYYSSPIDGEYGPEAFINSWPLDESYIDYVEGLPNSGIIANSKQFPTLTKDLLLSLNQKNGEQNISLGIHAIEFLLWGQDLSAQTPGMRRPSDYMVGQAPNAARRRTYLKLASELLLEALMRVHMEWKESYQAYLSKEIPSTEAMQKILPALIKLVGEEIAQERLYVSVETAGQEDEHSCFSDTTHLDAYGDFIGIKRVLFGLQSKGGFLTLLKDEALKTKIKTQVAKTEKLLTQIPAPFDQAILKEPGKGIILNAVTHLEDLADMLEEASVSLGYKVR